MSKLSLLNNNATVQLVSTGNKGIHTFPDGISLKVSIITPLEFELPYYDITVQLISHYATGTFPKTGFKD